MTSRTSSTITGQLTSPKKPLLPAALRVVGSIPIVPTLPETPAHLPTFLLKETSHSLFRTLAPTPAGLTQTVMHAPHSKTMVHASSNNTTTSVVSVTTKAPRRSSAPVNTEPSTVPDASSGVGSLSESQRLLQSISETSPSKLNMGYLAPLVAEMRGNAAAESLTTEVFGRDFDVASLAEHVETCVRISAFPLNV